MEGRYVQRKGRREGVCAVENDRDRMAEQREGGSEKRKEQSE